MQMPDRTMLCTLQLAARTSEGQTVASNFIHYFVSPGYPEEREQLASSLILRSTPFKWALSEWSLGHGDRAKEQAEDTCHGSGHGFFEWLLPTDGLDLGKAARLKVLCELSSRRSDWPQTDDDVYPTTVQLSLNGVRLYQAVLRNHPHDARGVLSYLRGGLGAYGYLAHAYAEGEVVKRIIDATSDRVLRLRATVPEAALARGGLTVYGAECGRFPLGPTVIVDW
jgi:hypothetical protein